MAPWDTLGLYLEVRQEKKIEVYIHDRLTHIFVNRYPDVLAQASYLAPAPPSLFRGHMTVTSVAAVKRARG